MDIMQRRAALIGSLKKDNVAYEAYNLSFDGTDSTVINTGLYLFTAENINRDFEFIAEGIVGANISNSTIICAKHNGNSYGFLVRTTGSTSTTYNGTIFVKSTPNIAKVIIRRENGVITTSGENITNPNASFVNNVFAWPLVLGCAIDDYGSHYRHATGTIEHVKVTWL